MKRILALAVAVLCLYGVSVAIDNPSSVETININTSANNPHAAQRWIYTTPGYFNTTNGCTTAAIMGSDFSNWTLWLKRSKDDNCDSCAAKVYWDGSLDASNWVAIDNQTVAGKTTDTLGMVLFWPKNTMTGVDGDTTGGGEYNTYNVWYGKYFKYYRWRILSANAANCSTYFHDIKLYGRK
jgi:hypothetical protein